MKISRFIFLLVLGVVGAAVVVTGWEGREPIGKWLRRAAAWCANTARNMHGVEVTAGGAKVKFHPPLGWVLTTGTYPNGKTWVNIATSQDVKDPAMTLTFEAVNPGKFSTQESLDHAMAVRYGDPPPVWERGKSRVDMQSRNGLGVYSQFQSDVSWDPFLFQDYRMALDGMFTRSGMLVRFGMLDDKKGTHLDRAKKFIAEGITVE